MERTEENSAALSRTREPSRGQERRANTRFKKINPRISPPLGIQQATLPLFFFSFLFSVAYVCSVCCVSKMRRDGWPSQARGGVTAANGVASSLPHSATLWLLSTPEAGAAVASLSFCFYLRLIPRGAGAPAARYSRYREGGWRHFERLPLPERAAVAILAGRRCRRATPRPQRAEQTNQWQTVCFMRTHSSASCGHSRRRE